MAILDEDVLEQMNDVKKRITELRALWVKQAHTVNAMLDAGMDAGDAVDELITTGNLLAASLASLLGIPETEDSSNV